MEGRLQQVDVFGGRVWGVDEGDNIWYKGVPGRAEIFFNVADSALIVRPNMV